MIEMKKTLSVIFAILLIFSAMPLVALEIRLPAFSELFRTAQGLTPTAKASDYLTSGYCGDTLQPFVENDKNRVTIIVAKGRKDGGEKKMVKKFRTKEVRYRVK